MSNQDSPAIPAQAGEEGDGNFGDSSFKSTSNILNLYDKYSKGHFIDALSNESEVELSDDDTFEFIAEDRSKRTYSARRSTFIVDFAKHSKRRQSLGDVGHLLMQLYADKFNETKYGGSGLEKEIEGLDSNALFEKLISLDSEVNEMTKTYPEKIVHATENDLEQLVKTLSDAVEDIRTSKALDRQAKPKDQELIELCTEFGSRIAALKLKSAMIAEQKKTLQVLNSI